MEKIKYMLKFVVLIALIMASCNSENTKSSTVNQEEERAENPSDKLPKGLIGIYHGVQEPYYMKNKYGEVMVIGGNKIAIPSSDFKFILDENNTASLQQTDLEDNERHYYDGSYKVISNDSGLIKLELSLSDKQGSSPTFVLEINKMSKLGSCIVDRKFGGSDFKISKIDKN